MKRSITWLIAAGAMLVPAGVTAHEYVAQTVCTTTVSQDAPSNDCARVDTDTELEDGIIVTLDGDDSNPRGDDTSDGYIAVHVARDGVTVYCEDERGFNHAEERPGGAEDEANGDNEVCEP